MAPENLAALFAMVLARRAESLDLQRAVADRLVDLTVRVAGRSSPFYAQRFRGLVGDDEVFGTRDLRRIAPLTRSEVVAAGTSLRNRSSTYGFTTYTTGTTGRPLLIDRSVEEQNYLDSFFSRLHDVAGQPGSLGVAVVLDTGFHGRSLTVPTRVIRLPVSATTTHGMQTVADLLHRRFRVGDTEGPPVMIGGHVTSLVRVTTFLSQRYSPGHFANVRVVQSGCEHLSPEARRTLEDFWQVAIQDRFGTTESLCGAWSCTLCSGYHFEPYGHIEVLDPVTAEPIDDGTGALHITSFFPLSQMTPFIRYGTDDLVSVGRGACVTGADRYELLGRYQKAVMHRPADGPRMYLAETDIIDVLESEPLVARLSRPNPFLPDDLAEVGTGPVFDATRLQDGATSVTVRLRVDPGDEIDFVDVLARRLRRRLSDAYRAGDTRATATRPPVQLTFVGPDGVYHPWEDRQ